MATTLGLLILIAATALIVPIISYLSNAEMRLRQLPADASHTIKETYRPLFVLAAAIAILLPPLANVAVFPQEVRAIFILSAIALSGLIVTLALTPLSHLIPSCGTSTSKILYFTRGVMSLK